MEMKIQKLCNVFVQSGFHQQVCGEPLDDQGLCAIHGLGRRRQRLPQP